MSNRRVGSFYEPKGVTLPSSKAEKNPAPHVEEPRRCFAGGAPGRVEGVDRVLRVELAERSRILQRSFAWGPVQRICRREGVAPERGEIVFMETISDSKDRRLEVRVPLWSPKKDTCAAHNCKL